MQIAASFPLRCDLLLDPKMLFDCGDALKRVINFLSVSGDIGHARFQFFEIAPNVRHFRVDGAISAVSSRNSLRSSFVAMCSTT